MVYYGIKELFQPRSVTDDETVDSFFRRRFGHEVQITYVSSVTDTGKAPIKSFAFAVKFSKPTTCK